MPLLVVGYTLVGQSILVTNRLAGGPLGIAQSYELFGALILLALLYAAGRSGRTDGASVPIGSSSRSAPQ
jgi:hypothetical protein